MSWGAMFTLLIGELPNIIRLIRDTFRDVPDDQVDARWAETKKRVQAANDRWNQSKQ